MMRILMMITLFTSLLSGCTKYESPDYRVVRSEGTFEIRDYPAISVVSTPMQQRGSDGSFMKLFRYISGRNEQAEKISMTTPVLMTGSSSGTMSFVVPKAVVERGVPTPSNPDVTVRRIPAARYAAYRFSGSGTPTRSDASAEKLKLWIKSQNLTPAGTPLFAYYNPPWTPGFLRRNEVLLPLAPETP